MESIQQRESDAKIYSSPSRPGPCICMWDLKDLIVCCLLNLDGGVGGELVSAKLAKLCCNDTITAATTAIPLSHCVNTLQHCPARSILASV